VSTPWKREKRKTKKKTRRKRKKDQRNGEEVKNKGINNKVKEQWK